MDAQPHAVDSDVTAVFLANLPSLERYARSLTRDEEAPPTSARRSSSSFS